MKLINQIFCDDIRIEINNKFTLIGLYSDRLLLIVSKGDEDKIVWPQPTRLSLFLRFQIEENDKKPDIFEFKYLGWNLEFPTIRSKVSTSQKSNIFTLHIVSDSIPLELGMLGFTLKMYSENEKVYEYEDKNALRIEMEIK